MTDKKTESGLKAYMDEPLADEERLKNYTQEEKPSKKQLEDETRNVCAFYLHLKTSHFELPVVQSLPILPGKKHLFSLKKKQQQTFHLNCLFMVRCT